MMAPMATASSLRREVAEHLAEDHLADDDGGQADDDGAPAHVHVALKPWYWASRAPDRATRPLDSIRPSTLVKLVLMPWARAMLGLAPVARREAAQLRAEEPVQQGDDRRHKDGYQQAWGCSRLSGSGTLPLVSPAGHTVGDADGAGSASCP